MSVFSAVSAVYWRRKKKKREAKKVINKFNVYLPYCHISKKVPHFIFVLIKKGVVPVALILLCTAIIAVHYTYTYDN